MNSITRSGFSTLTSRIEKTGKQQSKTSFGELLTKTGTDRVTFGAATIRSADAKLTAYAAQLLTEAGVQPGQEVYIEAFSDNLPLLRKMVEVAYRDLKTGKVHTKVKEPELERMKKQYGAAKYDFQVAEEKRLAQVGAARINLSLDVDQYAQAGLTHGQTDALKRSITKEFSPGLRSQMTFNPDGVLKALGYEDGQPISISGHRERLPEILSIAERAFQRGSKLVSVATDEYKELDLTIPFYKHASDELLSTVRPGYRDQIIEMVDKNVARLLLDGDDPALYAEVDGKRISKYGTTQSKAVSDVREGLTNDNPWAILYAPTTVSAKAAGYKRFDHAIHDARKITRMDNLEAHVENLKAQTKKLNELVEQGFRTLHFVSHGADGKPDAKTNLTVGLNELSRFASAQLTTTRGQVCQANIPSEESFTSPVWSSVNGKVTMTKPVSINGKIIDGITMEFENGRLARHEDGSYKVSATQNEEALLNWLKDNEHVDKLGEIAIVPESPIFLLNRIFNSILLDENAANHLALGSPYAETLLGANDIKDPAKKRDYLLAHGLNDTNATSHVDFMFGAPNVKTVLKNEEGEARTVLENNKFML